ncbi:hypothetical protein [Selenomonas sp. AB3002]|uniref:hypothetical protein n=1 Tax=Selenomonas sp. AB3002 TaxID=1392502 RepID=UPI000ADDD6ED
MKIQLADVFAPGSMPDHTYINRSSEENGVTYEARLEKALMKKGNLISITGGTKTGKRVLCIKVVGAGQCVVINGSEVNKPEDFWQYIAEALEIPEEIQVSLSQQESEGTKFAASAKAALFNLLSTSIATGQDSTQTSGQNTLKKLRRSNALIMNALIKSGITLVIDDFHYIDKETQLYLARVLKAQIFHGLRAVLLSLPHRADEAIRLNPDLIGRVSFIELAPWSKSDLEQIGRKGFALLGMEIGDEALDMLASESALSPQLMQENCFNLAFAMRGQERAITLEDVRAAFHDTVTEYKHYQDVVAQILEGPSKGRSRRRLYKNKDGREGDIYDIFLLGISDDPPMLKFSLEEIQRRIKKVIAENEAMPAPLNLSKTAKNVEKIVKEAMPNADTLDWKEGELYILDPFLLFYLRWSREWKSGLRDISL